MTQPYTGGTATLAKWQDKFAKRMGLLEPGRYMIVFDVPQAGTVEPTWSVMAVGQVENWR